MPGRLVTSAGRNLFCSAHSEGKISISTPYGKALSGKKIGDIVDVTTPMGVKKFKLTSLITIHNYL